MTMNCLKNSFMGHKVMLFVLHSVYYASRASQFQGVVVVTPHHAIAHKTHHIL